MWIIFVAAIVLAPLLSFRALPYQAEVPTLEQAERERFAARYDRAAEFYGRLLLGNPRDPEAHYGRVFSLIQAKRSKEAYQAAEEALRQVPQSAGAQAAAGIAAFRSGDMTGAETFFEAARKLDAQHPGALRGLAMVHRAMSKFKSSRELMLLAYEAKPGDPDAIQAYANSLKGNEHIAALERALAIFDPASDPAKQLRSHIASDRAIGDRKLRELASSYERSTVKLYPVLDGARKTWAVAIRVQLNEKDGIKLLLDTGASGVSLSPGIASKAGLEKLSEEQTDVTGVGNDKAQSALHYLASGLRVGSVILRNLPIQVFSRAQGLGCDGIIGPDVFQAFLVTIDFPKMELRLDPRPYGTGLVPEEPKDAGAIADGSTRAIRFGNHFLLPTLVNQSKDAKLFLIDSGASTNVIDTAAARTVTGVYEESRTVVQGVQGKVNRISRANRVELVFAGFRQSNLDIISYDLEKMGDSMGMALGGIIGMPTLGALRVTFDYLEGTVRLEYQ